MSTTIRLRDNEHGAQNVFMPDPDRVPVAPIRKPLEKTIKCGGKMTESAAGLQAAFTARNAAEAAAESAANTAAADGGDVPAKALQKALRAAEDRVAEARIEHRARVHAYVTARRELIDAIEAHTPAWRDAALSDLDRGIAKLATAKESALRAGAELTEPLTVLEMLRVLPQTRQPILGHAGPSGSALSEALTHLTNAIGAAMEAAAQHRAVVSESIAEAKAAKAADGAIEAEAERTRAIHAERAERRAKALDDD